MAAQPNPDRFIVAHDPDGRPTVWDADKRFVEHEGEWSEQLAEKLRDDLNSRPRGASALHWISVGEQAPWMSLGGREIL